MKQLLLMRHGKSDWQAGVADFERPLNKRGVKAASFMGKFCLEKKLVPDLIYSSPANRAKTTAKLFAESSKYSADIEYCESFYFGYKTELLDKLKSTPDSVQRLLIVGHNPTWSELVSHFSGIYVEMTTANIAVLELKIESWANLECETCRLLQLYKPRDLM